MKFYKIYKVLTKGCEICKLSRVPSRGELFLLDYYAINDRIYCNVARSASMRGVRVEISATIDPPPHRLISTKRKQERFDRRYSLFFVWKRRC